MKTIVIGLQCDQSDKTADDDRPGAVIGTSAVIVYRRE